MSQLGGIIESSKGNNERAGITGALAFDGLWFFQVLEGDRTSVWSAFQRILKDPRHQHVVLASAGDTGERAFHRWSMSLAVRNDTTAPIFDRYSDRGRIQPATMSADDMLNILIETVPSQKELLCA